MELVRVMSYNVCHYNFDIGEQGFPKTLFPGKADNLREMLWEAGPDFIGIQEDATYIDVEHVYRSADYLYAPAWSFRGGASGNTMRAKFPVIKGTHKTVKFSTGRGYRQAAFEVDGGRLLMISAHPTAKTGMNEQRLTEYKELFAGIAAELWDYCIVTGDFNTTDVEDKKNLAAISEKNGFSMAIGGDYLPWLTTYLGHDGKAKQSLDNVLVSGAAEIRRVQVLRSWYTRLYSDHVPVVAEVALGWHTKVGVAY